VKPATAYDNLIIYHRDCLDGFTAAWVCVRCLEALGEACELWPADYGEDPPQDYLYEGKMVYVVDFSYTSMELQKMWRLADKLRVLDHHASARKNCAGLSFCQFSETRSGAGMAYDYFPNSLKAVGDGGQWLVDFVEDWDTWHKALKWCDPVHYYLQTIEMTLSNWDSLAVEFQTAFGTVLAKGIAIERYANKMVGAIAGMAYKTHLPGWGRYPKEVLQVNCPPQLASMVGHRLLEVYKDEPCVAMWYRNEQRFYKYSLRSRRKEECNVAEIAGYYGGGGHETAAGFRSGEIR